MVVLVAVGLSSSQLAAVEDEIHRQASLLPRGDIVVKALANSYVIQFDTLAEAMNFTNDYAPEHLILYTAESSNVVDMVQNAGSVFVGAWSPVSCGDYASGTNHVLTIMYLFNIRRYLLTASRKCIAESTHRVSRNTSQVRN
jgi:phosphoribosyl-ATP pyrophosphohydrolase / phosphoribosyl-AMP cyclohydrolase / histidinol dehydrogenase